MRLALMTLRSIACLLIFSNHATASEEENKLTSIQKLPNGIPLIIRETPGSDIVNLSVTFMTGSADEAADRRVINQLTLESMAYSTKSFSKQKIFALTEKYSIGISCGGGVEISRCAIQTIKDYLPQAINLLAAVTTEPSFNSDDINLAKQRRIANFQKETQNPESAVNNVVNRVFYPEQHPYRLLPEDGVQQTKALGRTDLQAYHQSLLDASKIFITYAGPKLTPATMKTIQKKFSKIPKKDQPKKIVVSPAFDPNKRFALEHRTIPTAYIRVKFNAPAITAKSAAAADLMFEILSERLQEEIRTKRSLSYAVYAGTIQYTQGIGMIAVSTSKPKETIDAIVSVVKKFKEKGVKAEELDEQRNVFTTSYFLTLESQSSLAAALASFQNYFDDARKLYELPNQLAKVTPEDVQKVAKEYLKNFRVGVVYDKEKFDSKWLKEMNSL
jgi:zinc protease